MVAAGAVAVLVVVAALVRILGDGAPDGAPEETSTLPRGAALPRDALLWTVGKDDAERAFVGDSEEAQSLPLEGPLKGLTLTADRRTVLFLSHNDDRDVDSLWAVGTGGEDPRRIIDDDGRCPSAGRPSVSPDDTMVALACRAGSTSDSNLKGIRIYSVAGTLLRILDDEYSVGTPTWTNDGRSVVYFRQTTEQVGDTLGSNLYVADADDEDAVARPLTTAGGVRDDRPVVTRDRRTLVFVRHTAGDESFLYRMHLEVDGETIKPASRAEPMTVADTPISGDEVALSPRGDRLVYLNGGDAWAVPLDLAATSERAVVQPGVRQIAWARR